MAKIFQFSHVMCDKPYFHNLPGKDSEPSYLDPLPDVSLDLLKITLEIFYMRFHQRRPACYSAPSVQQEQ